MSENSTLLADNIVPIAIQADYQTTVELEAAYPELFVEHNIWAQKFDSTREYFDFWTREQNYLVQQRGKFTLVLECNADYAGCTADAGDFLYEYDPIITHIAKRYSGFEEGGPVTATFVPTARFVVLRHEFGAAEITTEPVCYSSLQGAKDAVYQCPDWDDIDTWFIIVDLQQVKPWFLKRDVPSIIGTNTNRTRCYTKDIDNGEIYEYVSH